MNDVLAGVPVGVMRQPITPIPGQQREAAYETRALAGAYFLESDSNRPETCNWTPQVEPGALIPSSSRKAMAVNESFGDPSGSERPEHLEEGHASSLICEPNSDVPDEDRSWQIILAEFPSAAGLPSRDPSAVHIKSSEARARHRCTKSIE